MPIPPPTVTDPSLNLAMAVVASSHAPVLLLDGNRSVVAASVAFGQAFGIDTAKARGHALASLGSGEWDVPQLASLLKATASGLAEVTNYEFDLKREGRGDRRLVVNAQKLSYGEGEDVRLLLAIADVTDMRVAETMNDDLLRDKRCCFRSCSTASPIVFRSSPACFSRAPSGFNRPKYGIICTTRITG